MIYSFKGLLLIVCSIIFLIPDLTKAQIDDTGLWTGINIQKKLKRRLVFTLNEQLRLFNDVTTVKELLTDVGIEYTFNKKIKAAVNYRFINSNKFNYYSKKHRFYTDLSYKQKIHFISLIIRERIQEEYKDIYSSERGKIPEWLIRSKLTARFDMDKKYEPYLAYEQFYVLDNAKEEEGYNSVYRYEAGFDYNFNRANSINPFVIFQHNRPDDFNSLIYGFVYSYSF